MKRLRKFATIAAIAAIVSLLGMQVLRQSDLSADEAAWRALASPAGPATRFDPRSIASLPEPARRYFTFSIAPGTPIRTAVELRMQGEIGLGSKLRPNYMTMEARQVLAGVRGFVWQTNAGARLRRFSGSDGYSDGEGWTRFWLFGAVPIVRAGGDRDFARSAAGRAVAESAFWLPSALLPSSTVRWEPLGPDRARVHVTDGPWEHRLDLTVGPDGRPLAVSILRWSRENPERRWQLQPFGGTPSGFRQVQGYRIAMHIEGGNWFGTPDYFPFYRASVSHAAFH
jgi:hypothetical protein